MHRICGDSGCSHPRAILAEKTGELSAKASCIDPSQLMGLAHGSQVRKVHMGARQALFMSQGWAPGRAWP
jgi:hypothetical protein